MTPAPPAIDRLAIKLISGKQAWHYRIVPDEQMNGQLAFHIDESNYRPDLNDELELLTGKKIVLHRQPGSMIQELLEKYYPSDRQDSRQLNDYYTGDADSFLNNLIAEARNLKSSDIHIEIYEEKCRVRIRIDGVLVQRY